MWGGVLGGRDLIVRKSMKYFECKQIRGRGKFECKQLRDGQNVSTSKSGGGGEFQSKVLLSTFMLCFIIRLAFNIIPL